MPAFKENDQFYIWHFKQWFEIVNHKVYVKSCMKRVDSIVLAHCKHSVNVMMGGIVNVIVTVNL